MSDIDPFIIKLANAIPCFYHLQDVEFQQVIFKKHDTMLHEEMGRFATVQLTESKNRLRIVACYDLADPWCKTVGVYKEKKFDSRPGLELYVKYNSDAIDYKTALEVLRRIKRRISP